ncbi:MAG: hypothetical protein KKH12_10185 [Gammaproteobacteria bacterium]|nr:hypothetical protein [Gammaproteobacteria bacterium]
MSRKNGMQFLVIVIFLLFMQRGVGAEKSAHIYAEDLRDLALQECLNINYTKLGAYKLKDIHDASLYLYSYGYEQRYNVNEMNSLTEFVDKETGHFYTEKLPLKYEENTTMNGVFARCMAFYKSEK